MLDGAAERHVQSIEDATGPFDGHAVVLVALVAGDLRLVDAEALGELALSEAEADAERDEKLPEAVEILELADVAALEPLVALDLLFELEVERYKRIHGALELVALEALLAQTGLVEVVPSISVMASSLASGAPDPGAGHLDAAGIRALGREMGAGTVVSGVYYRQGDSIRFQIQIAMCSRLGTASPSMSFR